MEGRARVESELSPQKAGDQPSDGGHPSEAEADCDSQQGKGR